MPNIDDRYFEYSLTENGSDTVVFLNGFRINFNSWNKVITELSANYSMLLFNRLGVGSSSRATTEQTGDVVVNDIREFVFGLELKAPYYLVAHSLGGIYANLYARTFPEEVSGVVFVDAPHPLEIEKQRNYKAPLFLRAINELVKSVEKRIDKYRYSEDECIEETITQIQNAPLFPNIPVAVVSGIKKMGFVPQGSFDIHLYFQEKLLDLSEHAVQYTCGESGHFPQLTEPKVVANVIRETIQRTRCLK